MNIDSFEFINLAVTNKDIFGNTDIDVITTDLAEAHAKHIFSSDSYFLDTTDIGKYTYTTLYMNGKLFYVMCLADWFVRCADDIDSDIKEIFLFKTIEDVRKAIPIVDEIIQFKLL